MEGARGCSHALEAVEQKLHPRLNRNVLRTTLAFLTQRRILYAASGIPVRVQRPWPHPPLSYHGIFFNTAGVRKSDV